MLNLRSVVKNLPLLQKALEGCQSQLLRIIQEVCLFLPLIFAYSFSSHSAFCRWFRTKGWQRLRVLSLRVWTKTERRRRFVTWFTNITLISSIIGGYWSGECPRVRRQSKRSFVVLEKLVDGHLRPTAIDSLTLHAKHTRRTSEIFSSSTGPYRKPMSSLYHLCIKILVSSSHWKRLIWRGSYRRVLLTLRWRKESGCFQVWNWYYFLFFIEVECCLTWHFHQKKMNARMKDALDETLILSDKWVAYTYIGGWLKIGWMQNYTRSRCRDYCQCWRSLQSFGGGNTISQWTY